MGDREQVIGTPICTTTKIPCYEGEYTATSPVFLDCLVIYEWVNQWLPDNRHADHRMCGRLQLFEHEVQTRDGLKTVPHAVYTVPRGRKEKNIFLGPGSRVVVLNANLLDWRPTQHSEVHAVIGSWEEAIRRLNATADWRQHLLYEYPPRRPPMGVVVPPRDTTSHDGFARDAAVHAWALQRARWRCEACGCEAPFRTEQGDPYLEVHHLRRLADGGSDTVDNVVALCPSCHREVHLGENADRMRLQLLELRSRDSPVTPARTSRLTSR